MSFYGSSGNRVRTIKSTSARLIGLVRRSPQHLPEGAEKRPPKLRFGICRRILCRDNACLVSTVAQADINTLSVTAGYLPRLSSCIKTGRSPGVLCRLGMLVPVRGLSLIAGAYIRMFSSWYFLRRYSPLTWFSKAQWPPPGRPACSCRIRRSVRRVCGRRRLPQWHERYTPRNMPRKRCICPDQCVPRIR